MIYNRHQGGLRYSYICQVQQYFNKIIKALWISIVYWIINRFILIIHYVAINA